MTELELKVLSAADALVAKLKSAEAEVDTLRARVAEAERDRDDARRRLFPYADDTTISGMSWNGFYLIGNPKSIKELQRIEHRSAQLEQFSAAYDESKARLTAALEAALSASDKEWQTPESWKPTHKHVKRGSTYRLDGYGEIQTDTPLTDYAKVAIYRAQDGTTWVRPVSEFEDGRFEPLPAAPKPGDVP